MLEKYQELAECPDEAKVAKDIIDDVSKIEPSLSLCPTDDRSSSFLSSLYSQLLPCFSSTQMHVGFDGATDVTQGRSKRAGTRTQVSLAFLRRVSSLAAMHGKKTVQFWADVLGGPDIEFSPSDLPARAVAMEWGYESDYPFSSRCSVLAKLGIPFYTCPSTSGHNSLGGRLSNAVENIKSAAKAALRHNGVGMLLTDWGDNGHLQPQVVSYPGYVVGAGAAWNVTEALSASESDLELICRLLDSHFFRDGDEAGVLGSVVCLYGDMHLVAEGKEGDWESSSSPSTSLAHGTRLFKCLVYRAVSPSGEGLNLTGLRRAQRRVEKSLDILNSYTGRANSADVLELQLVGELLRIACRVGILICVARNSGDVQDDSVMMDQLSGVTRSDIVNRLLQVLLLYRICWDARCLPHSFSKSVAFLERPLRDLCRGLPQMMSFVEERCRTGWITPRP